MSNYLKQNCHKTYDGLLNAIPKKLIHNDILNIGVSSAPTFLYVKASYLFGHGIMKAMYSLEETMTKMVTYCDGNLFYYFFVIAALRRAKRLPVFEGCPPFVTLWLYKFL